MTASYILIPDVINSIKSLRKRTLLTGCFLFYIVTSCFAQNPSSGFTVKDSSRGSNLIVNGDFELGNSFFSSEYDYIEDTLFHGKYTVTSDITSLNMYLKLPTHGDHTSGKGKYMVVDSKIFRNSHKSKIWISQPIKVRRRTTYVFIAWFSMLGAGSPPELSLLVNDKPIGPSFKTLDRKDGWTQLAYTWSSGKTKRVVLSIENFYYYQYMEDYALDDLFFGEVKR